MTKRTLSIDFETRSTVDLKKCGVYVYAQHPSTEILCMAYAFDEEEPKLWRPLQPAGEGVRAVMDYPLDVVKHLWNGGAVRAHNAQFERVMWKHVMSRYGFFQPKLEQWHCTAAEAAAMALPRALGQCAEVLGVPVQKDKLGHRLMLKLCKPRRIEADGTIVWWDDPVDLERLFAYCKNDVRTERAVSKAVRRLSPHERELYLLDQRINDRGIYVDATLVRAAQAIVDRGVAEANAQLDELTAGSVSKVSQSGRLVKWLNEQHVETDSVAKAPLKEMLEGELTETVRHALQLRADAGRSSVAKLKSLVSARCVDGFARGLVLFCGAGTGRWSGKLIQPQNFPRGEVADVEAYIPDVLAGAYEILDLVAHPIVVIVSMLRAMLTAPPGCELIAGDFSAIEARVLNWLANEEDVLDSFRKYDAGDKSQDPYKRMAVRMGRAATVADVQYVDRQAGKAAELGCGFQMGDAKFVTAAWDVYQVRVTPEQALQAVEAYRASHPRVVDLWYETERACLRAVREPGSVFPCASGRVRATCRGAYLYVVLPSGRALTYAAPKIVTALIKSKKTGETYEKQQLEFSGMNGLTKRWERQRAYGGFLVENVVQAVARDLMADAMLRAERRGYPPVLTVHDEVVACVPEGEGSVEDFVRIMSELPAWAAGCPVTAEAWRGVRYRK